MTSLDKSGHDIDLLGDGTPITPILLPDPASGRPDCPVKNADGTCMAGCYQCATFASDWEEWLRRHAPAEMETANDGSVERNR